MNIGGMSGTETEDASATFGSENMVATTGGASGGADSLASEIQAKL